MATERSERIVRTSDGLQFTVSGGGKYSSTFADDVGELVRTESTLSVTVEKMARSVVEGLRRIAPSKARINFGLALSPGGAFVVTQGQSDAHVIIELEFERAAVDASDRDISGG
jgi:Trypsin-co-occurring domain 1